MVSICDYYGKSRIKNCILEMIKHELSIENYYISYTRSILVRIDRKTADNQVFGNKFSSI